MQKGRTRHHALLNMRTALAPLVCALVAGTAAPSHAEAQDPHALYESRCAACHEPHARDFAKKALDFQNGAVVMRSSGAPLALFLEQHPRGLAPADAAVLIKHFSATLETGFLYQEKCIVCHERASTLARLKLFERDGVIEGRYTYRDISEFLRNHGRLTPMEVETILKMFHRQLAPSKH